MVGEMGLSAEDAEVLTEVPELVAYFMEAAAEADPKACANWIRGELRAQLREAGVEPWQSKVTPAHIAALVGLLDAGTVTVPAAKEVLAEVIASGEEPGAVIDSRGLGAMDEGDLAAIVSEIVAANPDQAQQLRDGKDKVIGFFVGQAMKRTSGRADPQSVQRLVREAVRGD
jgi:aspartyl-tRNA(Asn)/glutamyl-tRNA(Gln) amidotransferase subunit B